MATVPLLEAISLIIDPKPQSLYQNLSFPTQIPLQSIKTTKRLLKPLKITTKHTNFLHTKEHDSAANNRTLIKQFVDTMLNALQALQKPASVAITSALFVYINSHSAALAASGGRMGGSSFSSRSSDSSSSWSSSSSSSSWSSSSSSSSWSSSGSSMSYSHRSSSPPSRPPPFGFTLDRNGRYLGQRSYWTRTISPSLSYTVTVAQPKPAGPSFGLILLYTMGFGFCVIVIFSSISRSVRSGGSCDRPERIISDEMNSVVKIQVGLLGTATSLQRDLNRICETADTSTSMGLSYILQG